ncbi:MULTISPECIES: ABC transporter ATP-binding protein [Zunongwangia]|jgi:subfamily B ATP-binding cassette protein MsbA|uniref:ABC-type transporter ATP-binding and permease component n=3 Tax=Zunongwangia profunda TaxID=398743 RepID=D5BHT3_ZUNPS|nr:ABC transporter transmembrane domain-containing protein [Zunongwangia profunda]MAG86465.1 ABC transporter ATP-binding protein [Flavobacteriaceae bacterium]MAS69674.1 ABC transporter ATP-binding protein [Zunongwangia sp.]ADF51321.1 ABC-type transporter ATP-binding and permease component [Zunongwangia profunda SM-A87]MCC4229121.1 ABC transporter ATP-binding protein/permease [Zunongwangia profunda]HCV82232.1 ABC transporter ATP-binding protein [Zunongwangia profunda]|tara:strand:+ start:7179 stop:8948 length:1770 start_codon:yes stop_codon:yes gene_type:complete
MASKTGNAFDFDLFKRLLRYTNPYKLTFYFVAITAILLSFFAVARPYLLQVTIDDSITPKDNGNLIFYVSLMIGFLILEVTSQFFFIYFANLLGQNVVRDLRVNLFKHMLQFKMKYYDKSAVGRLVTRAVSDIETISSIFSQGLFMIISDLLKMIVVLGFMFYKSWQLTLLVITVLPFIIYATRVFQKKMKIAFEDVRTQVADLNTFVQERITGMKIVQLFNREKSEYNNFKNINDRHRKAWVKTVWYNSIFFPIAEMSTSITVGLIVWFGGLQAVNDNPNITLGVIIAFIELSQMLFRPLRQIADKFNTLQMGMVAANRVFGILDTDSTISDEGEKQLQSIKGDIEFKNVRFSYVEGEEVLRGVNFTAKAGETIAIVGATGAGKSTIINLLNRFYEIDSGTIAVDGIDIKDVTIKSLRSEIAVVLQNVFLFADTIMHNIKLDNPDITEDDVITAAKQIGIHDFISSLPNGYHYNVKERGVMLSSGQRQLISFLRAYVSNPSILVLDEATSSVDTYSEQLIQEATDKITKGRTSIVIAHRLATIKKADKIMVMDSGEIVEMGTHDELLLKENGHYRKLYEVQFMAEESI